MLLWKDKKRMEQKNPIISPTMNPMAISLLLMGSESSMGKERDSRVATDASNTTTWPLNHGSHDTVSVAFPFPLMLCGRTVGYHRIPTTDII